MICQERTKIQQYLYVLNTYIIIIAFLIVLVSILFINLFVFGKQQNLYLYIYIYNFEYMFFYNQDRLTTILLIYLIIFCCIQFVYHSKSLLLTRVYLIDVNIIIKYSYRFVNISQLQFLFIIFIHTSWISFQNSIDNKFEKYYWFHH